MIACILPPAAAFLPQLVQRTELISLGIESVPKKLWLHLQRRIRRELKDGTVQDEVLGKRLLL